MQVKIPPNLTRREIGLFLVNGLYAPYKHQVSQVEFDFSNLNFISPQGVAALYVCITRLQGFGIETIFKGHNFPTDGNKYLDDAGVFEYFLNTEVFNTKRTRATTIKLHEFEASQYGSHLYGILMPWISAEVQMDMETTDVLRATIEEIYHNVLYHAGSPSGCVFAQHFPNKNRLEVVIVDAGKGIPALVLNKHPELNHSSAIMKACEQGFTTKTNVQNRGVGLWRLSQYTAEKNGGELSIISLRGEVKVTQNDDGKMKLTPTEKNWVFPGTLVCMSFQTDRLLSLEDSLEKENFEWS